MQEGGDAMSGTDGQTPEAVPGRIRVNEPERSGLRAQRPNRRSGRARMLATLEKGVIRRKMVQPD